MTIDVDARMRAASGSLRRASERLPSPEVPPRPRVRPVTLAVAVLVVAALAAGMVVLRHDDRERVTTDETPTLPRLVPRELPEGLPPPTAVELPRVDSPLGLDSAAITVYGDPNADDPFATADLAVLESDVDPWSPLPPENEEPAAVRGHEGTSGDEPRLGVWVSWEEGPDRHLAVVSHTLDRGQLLAVAENLSVEGETAVLRSVPAGVPGPLERIGGVPDVLLTSVMLGMAPAARASAVGHMWGSETDEYDQSLIVTASAGDASDVSVIRWLTLAGDPVDVGGHAGWLGADDRGDITRRTVVWEEPPGVIVVVQAAGLTEAELLGVAENLRPADDDEWEALLDGAASGNAAPPDQGADQTDQAFVYIEGTYSAGTWVVFDDVDRKVCSELTPDDPAADAIDLCSEPDERVATMDDSDGNPVVVYGTLPEDAVDVGTPEPVGPDHIRETDDGRRIYAQPVEGSAPTAVVFYDADGQPVATEEVAP